MEYQRYKWGANRLQIQEATGADTTLQWEDEGYQVTGPRGRQVRVVLKDDRVVGWTNPAGGVTRIQRDDALRPIRLDPPEGGFWSLKWRGPHLNRIQNPAGASWTYRHNNQGLLVSMVGADGLERSFERNSNGTVRSMGLASGKTLLQRDRAGRLTGIQRPSGATTRIERNSRGDITAFVDPSGQRILLARSPSGRLTSITERTGEKWEFSSDVLGRVSGFETPSGGEFRWSRNSLGQIEEIQAGDDRRIRFKHNGAGMPTQIASSSGRERRFQWDPNGVLRRIQLEDQTEIQLQHDPLNRLTKIQTWRHRVLHSQERQRAPALRRPTDLQVARWGTLAKHPRTGLSTVIRERHWRTHSGGEHRRPKLANSIRLVRSLDRYSSGDTALRAQRDANGFLFKLTQETGNTVFQRDVRGLPHRDANRRDEPSPSVRRCGPASQNQLARGPALSAQYDSEGRLALLLIPIRLHHTIWQRTIFSHAAFGRPGADGRF